MNTERDNMLAGLPHKPFDPELAAARERAAELLCEYNFRTLPSEKEKSGSLIRRLFGKTGSGITITRPFFCDYGSLIETGDNFYANFNCTILDAGGVKFGDNVLLAPNVGIYTVGHPLDAALRNEGWESARPVTVGDNVWIGAGSIILGGVTIGRNSVIAAGSIVTKDIPPDTLAMGAPCRAVRTIGAADRAAYLAQIAAAQSR